MTPCVLTWNGWNASEINSLLQKEEAGRVSDDRYGQSHVLFERRTDRDFQGFSMSGLNTA